METTIIKQKLMVVDEMIYMVIGLIVILIIVILLFGFVEIGFDMDYDKSKMDFKVYIYRFDITKLILKKKKREKRNGELISSRKQKEGMDIKISLKILLRILNRIKYLENKPRFMTNFIIEYGLEEADVTAVLYAHINTIVYFILGLLGTYVDIEGSGVDIIPKYNEAFLKLHFGGILRIKIAQIIYISFLFITLGRELNGSTSNRKFNENYS